MRLHHGKRGRAVESSRRKERRLPYAYACDAGEPGLDGTMPPEERVREVLSTLGLAFEPLDEPAGCAASGPGMNAIAAYAKVARLLGLAEGRLARLPDDGGTPTVVTPCAACARSLSRAADSLTTQPALRGAVSEELAAEGLPFHPGSVRVRHLLVEDVGSGAIRARVRRPLSGLKVAPFEGCPRTAGGDAAEGGPSRLGELLAALGADVVDFPLRSHCCGGRAAEASEETATSLHVRLLRCAAERRADLVATACTRCARNLAGGRDAVNRRYGTRFATPVVHFTTLLADALAGDGVRS